MGLEEFDHIGDKVLVSIEQILIVEGLNWTLSLLVWGLNQTLALNSRPETDFNSLHAKNV